MAHYVICPHCSERYNRDKAETVIVGRRYYHKKCYDLMIAKQQKEEKDKQLLEEYIKQLFNISQLTKKITSQIKKFKTENNYTYSGMYKSLKWFYETKGNSIEKANEGIGIIPYIYSEVNQYYYNLYLIQKTNMEKNQHYEDRIVTFKISTPQLKTKKIKLFDI